MKRTAIFCFYDEEGIVDSSTKYLLNELKKISNYIITVINGSIKDINLFQQYSDLVIVRDNIGYDVSAYKSALNNSVCKEFIDKSTELILVNNTFFGPFISFDRIFDKMEGCSDFWGITRVETNMALHIQSYFMVYKEKIIRDKRFYDYFLNYINESQMNYLNVVAAFENGLMHYLMDLGYSYDTYISRISCDLYRNPYGSLARDGNVILKKKIFSDQYYSQNQVMASLKYIQENYNYDIKILKDYAYRKYNRIVDDKGIKDAKSYPPVADITQNSGTISRNDILNFIIGNQKIYIYGCGNMALNLYCWYLYPCYIKKLQGFIVSDNQIRKTEFQGLPVIYLSDLPKDNNNSIIVALNKKNSKYVYDILGENKKILYLYDIFNVH